MFQLKTPKIASRLKEKITTSRDVSMDNIKRAKRDMGSPHITALLRMFL